MKKLLLALLLAMLPLSAMAQGQPIHINDPVLGGINGECLYVNNGRLGQQVAGCGGIATSITINTTAVTGGTPADCLLVNANGTLGQATCSGGTATDITVGTTTVTGGTTTYVLYNNAGILGNLQTTTALGSGLVLRGDYPPFLPTGVTASIVAGNGSGASMTAGALENTIYGNSAGIACTTCNGWVAVGNKAAQFNVTGTSNTYVGSLAGQFNGNSNADTMIGAFAGRGAIDPANPFTPALTGATNTFLGEAAAITAYDATANNVCLGYNSCFEITGNTQSVTVVGSNAAAGFAGGNGLVAVGNAAYRFGTGPRSVIIGQNAGQGTQSSGTSHADVAPINTAGQAVIGVTNTANFHDGDNVYLDSIPQGATILSHSGGVNGTITISANLLADVTGGRTIWSITTPPTGTGAVIIGDAAGKVIKGAITPTLIGFTAGTALTTGANNTVVGFASGVALTTQGNNTLLGSSAGDRITAANTVAIGNSTMRGAAASALTGSNNTAVGNNAALNLGGTSAGNVIIGASLQYSGVSPPPTVTLNSNTIVGSGSANLKTGGSNDTIVGATAGAAMLGAGGGNTFIGQGTGATCTTCTNNIVLGNGADVTGATVNGVLNIGNAIFATALTTTALVGINQAAPATTLDVNGVTTSVGLTVSGAAVILSALASDATHTSATICEDTTSKTLLVGSGAAGICLGTSSIRFKQNIASLRAGLSEIDALRPVSYRYLPGYGTTNRDLYGFTAEQVADVMPELVGLDVDGRPNSVDWAGMVPVLVNAIRELKAEVDVLRSR